MLHCNTSNARCSIPNLDLWTVYEFNLSECSALLHRVYPYIIFYRESRYTTSIGLKGNICFFFSQTIALHVCRNLKLEQPADIWYLSKITQSTCYYHCYTRIAGWKYWRKLITTIHTYIYNSYFNILSFCYRFFVVVCAFFRSCIYNQSSWTTKHITSTQLKSMANNGYVQCSAMC